MQAIFKTYNRCLFKSTTGASFTLFSNIYSCEGRYLHVFYIIRFAGVICVGLSSLPPPGSQHTPVFRYLRQTCLVSPKQSSLSFDTLVPKVLEVQRAPQILTTKQLQSPSTCWSATESKLSSTFDTVNRAEDQTTRTPFYVVKETPSSTQCT